jgi:hypothetical protein
MGPITRDIQTTFFRAVRGLEPRYAEWLTPVEGTAPAETNGARVHAQ